MSSADRYDTSGYPEDQYQPGSNGAVLKNLLGIITREALETAETAELWLAEEHVELMLIHPFREGNGRLGRLLATLMGLQAGLPLLDFSEMAGWRKEEYFEAVRAGMERDYRPMTRLFADVSERSS